jgi:Rad3-related DNA helicase
MQHGYRAKLIQLTAKEKLCMCEEMDCNPLHCPYAKGHFDRVNDAVYDLLQKSDFFTREEILAQAEEFQVCPFEMSLDVATWADDIVCDYNYVFDPNVYLKRFFQEGVKGDYIFLVDEAHNLVERSREMYSARLCKEDFLQVKRIITPYSKKIAKALERCNKLLLEMKRECEGYAICDEIGPLYFALMRLGSAMDEFLQKPAEFAGREAVLDFYFELRNFLAIYELVDDHYVIYSEIAEDGRFYLKLFCVDPSENLQSCLDKAHATVFFSATLLPIHYYKSLLSTKEDNYAIYAESTFSPEQRLLLFGNNVSTKYTRRSAGEFQRMALYIARTIRCKKGNYMVFFPSYKLMEQVQEALLSLLSEEPGENVRVICQKNGMREREREEFLEEFSAESEDTLVALCVMGGIFGEGIDLKNDRLIGAIVVGTGLPQVSNEREILKNYYDERNGNGFDFAFRYPGMNKVLQAAGRVIRTTEDRGVILLLDERFLQRDYEPLYPREWADRRVCGADDVEELVREFWKNADET